MLKLLEAFAVLQKLSFQHQQAEKLLPLHNKALNSRRVVSRDKKQVLILVTIWQQQFAVHKKPVYFYFNPTALRMAKTPLGFGHSGSNWVNATQITIVHISIW